MKYLYIKMNPKEFNQREYDNFVRRYPSNEYSFLIDFVHNVKVYEIEEISPLKFDQLMNKPAYG
jgi:hypothetical protein